MHHPEIIPPFAFAETQPGVRINDLRLVGSPSALLLVCEFDIFGIRREVGGESMNSPLLGAFEELNCNIADACLGEHVSD